MHYYTLHITFRMSTFSCYHEIIQNMNQVGVGLTYGNGTQTFALTANAIKRTKMHISNTPCVQYPGVKKSRKIADRKKTLQCKTENLPDKTNIIRQKHTPNAIYICRYTNNQNRIASQTINYYLVFQHAEYFFLNYSFYQK